MPKISGDSPTCKLLRYILSEYRNICNRVLRGATSGRLKEQLLTLAVCYLIIFKIKQKNEVLSRRKLEMHQSLQPKKILSTAFYISLLILTLAFTSVYSLTFEYAQKLQYLLFPISFYAIIYFFSSYGKHRNIELYILFANFLWVALMCWLHHSNYNDIFSIHSESFWALMWCIFFFAGVSLHRVSRKKAIDWLSVIICGYLFILSVLALYGVFLGKLPIQSRFFSEFIYYTEESHNGLRHITFLGYHRNITTAWFFIGMCLMINQWFTCENRLWRIPIGIAGLFFFLIIGMQHSRSNYVATAVALALLTLSLLMHHFSNFFYSGKYNIFLKLITFCTAALAAVFLFYSAVSQSSTIISKIAVNISANQTEQIEISDGTSSGSDEASEIAVITDERSFLEDATSMTGRTTIWKAVIPAIKAKPSIAAIGYDDAIEFINLFTGVKYHYAHMHNTFLQALVYYGIPSMLLYIVFFTFLFVKMLKFYFSDKVKICDKIIVLPLSGLLLYGIIELLLSSVTRVSSVLFCFFAGVLISRYKEIFDSKKS